MQFQKALETYHKIIEDEINVIEGNHKVSLFYDPIRYMLTLKGKRIRPLLTVLVANVFGVNPSVSKYAGVAVELLHNFTLVHDDIMDNDETRRGKPTIHIKWDLGTAILAGDGLMGFAFQKLLNTPSGDVAGMARRFTETMIVICEGQGLDKMFEGAESVALDAYLDMIARKTAVLIELSCELGGLVASVESENVRRLREYGYALGMGFQIQDDLLDVLADEDELGKKVGSDLQMRKKTILTIMLRELTGDDSFFDLDLQGFKKYLNQYNIINRVTEMYQTYFSTAYEKLSELPDNEHRNHLIELTDAIKNRTW